MRRRRYEHLDVLYFTRPKKTSLMRITEDYAIKVDDSPPDLWERCFPCLFAGLRSLPVEPPMYATARLLVLPGMRQRPGVSNAELAAEYLTNACSSRPNELSRLAASLVLDDSPTRECVVEVMAYEPNLFSLDSPDTLSTVYTHALSSGVLEGADLEEARDSVFDALDAVAYRLATACIAMNEMPYIRFSHSGRGISEVVARSLAKALKQYRDDHPSFTPWGDARAYGDEGYGGSRRARAGEPSEPATVIVVDSVDDLAPALLHDITYSCLVTDLLSHEPCTPFRYTFRKGGEAGGRDVLLDESDPVWRLLRFEDMGTVIDTVDEGVRVANRRVDERSSLNPNDVNDLRELMAAVTGDEKLVDEKFTQHYRMKANIVDVFEKRALHELCSLEQVLVTGCDADGLKVGTKEVEKQMKAMMQDERLT